MFASVKDRTCVELESDIEYCVQNPKPNKYRGKEEIPLWSFSKYAQAGGKSTSAYQIRGVFLDLDKDNYSADQVEDMFVKILGNRQFYCHTTYSSTKDNRKWRIIIPIAEDQGLTREEYISVVEYFISIGLSDPNAKDPRPFIIPIDNGSYITVTSKPRAFITREELFALTAKNNKTPIKAKTVKESNPEEIVEPVIPVEITRTAPKAKQQPVKQFNLPPITVRFYNKMKLAAKYQEAIKRVKSAARGSREATLSAAAYFFGKLARAEFAACYNSENLIADLTQAASELGLTDKEISRAIQRSFANGYREGLSSAEQRQLK
jgi:hypothetical protein